MTVQFKKDNLKTIGQLQLLCAEKLNSCKYMLMHASGKSIMYLRFCIYSKILVVQTRCPQTGSSSRVVVKVRNIVSGFQTFLNKLVHLYLNICKHWSCYCQRFYNRTELCTLTTILLQLDLPVSDSQYTTPRRYVITRSNLKLSFVPMVSDNRVILTKVL